MFSHADGRYYTSKKHWRDHLKAHGKIEVGNEKVTPAPPPPSITEADVADAYDQWQAGDRPEKPKEGPPEYWEGDVEEVAVDA